MPVKARASEYVSMRMTEKMRKEVRRMCSDERRTLSQMLQILVEEALEKRNQRDQLNHHLARLQSEATQI